MELVALPAFTDNTIWMLHDGARALVVDPGDASVAEQALDSRRRRLAAILVTHQYSDHVGGVDALRARLDGAARERIPQPFAALHGGDRIDPLGLARAVEPGKRDIVAHTAWCEDERSRGRPTLPSTIERERSINPFLRCSVPEVAESAGAHGASSSQPVAVFAALREWKNRF